MSFEQPNFFRPEEIPKETLEKTPEVKPEISTAEKFATIKEYIGNKYERWYGETEEQIRVEKEFLKGLDCEQLEQAVGKKEFRCVFEAVSTLNSLREKMEEKGITEEEISKFLEEKGAVQTKGVRGGREWLGRAVLPERILEDVYRLRSADGHLNHILRDVVRMEMGIKPRLERGENFQKDKETYSAVLKERTLPELKIIAEKWQKNYSPEGREKYEKPMNIEGFEKFDSPKRKGKEIVRSVAEILPRGILSPNIENIKYEDRTRNINPEYGFSGKGAGDFYAPESGSTFLKGRIRIFQTDYTISELPHVLAHEWGHSMDPRLAEQKSLHPVEQLKMIIEWEKVREKEPEFSSYVAKINNPSKSKEMRLKSQESFAESVQQFLINPNYLEGLCPKRFEFCSCWLKKQFPEADFSLEKMNQKWKEYIGSVIPSSF